MREESNPKALLSIKSETPDKIEVWCQLRGARDSAVNLMIIGMLSLPGFLIFSVGSPAVRPWTFLGLAIFLAGFILFRLSPKPFITFFRGKLDATVTYKDRSYPMNLDDNPFEAKSGKPMAIGASRYFYIRIHGKILTHSFVDLMVTAESIDTVIYAAAVLDSFRHGSKWLDRRFLDAVRTYKFNWRRELRLTIWILAAMIAVISLFFLLVFKFYR